MTHKEIHVPERGFHAHLLGADLYQVGPYPADRETVEAVQEKVDRWWKEGYIVILDGQAYPPATRR